MAAIGTIESLWRYPVKSMAGETLQRAFVGFPGIYGDRMYAFHSSSHPKGFPYLTGREQYRMLLYRPRFRDPQSTVAPPNLTEAEKIEHGLAPVYGEAGEMVVEVITPTGDVLAVDDPALIEKLNEGLVGEQSLSLQSSDRSMTDCRPISLFSLQTQTQLADEVGINLDKRRFRANVYMDLGSNAGFFEDQFVGRSLRLGKKAVISVLERDPRCKMISLDPDTGEQNASILNKVTKEHEGRADIYGAVLVEGMVRSGDEIEVLN